jgi:hypothetical protein
VHEPIYVEGKKVMLMCIKYQCYSVVEKETNLCDGLWCIPLLNWNEQ